MPNPPESPQLGRAACRRRSLIHRALLLAAAVLLSLPLGMAALWSAISPGSWGAKESPPLLHRVEVGDFVHEITERGDVESASNVEIRCEVQSKNLAGTTILEIIPEGTYVQPGDVLVKLDASALNEQRTRQQITVSNSHAALIQAQSALETAQIAKREYLEGQYRLAELAIQIDYFVAKENYRRAEEYLKYSEGLADKGYVTQAQLDADQFALDKARKELEAAQTKLEVLQKFTREKMLKQLDADIKTAEAKVRSQQHSYELELNELARIESQIEKCVIRAPEAGQVVYANVYGYRGASEIIIQEGTQVRERQVIIRLPDPKRMQVKARINEAKIALLKEGMPATIRLDALQGKVLHGTVEKVNEYPAPTSWYNANVKDYETIVRIDSPPSGLRPGLTAEVTILVDHREGVLQVPVQAVFEHDKKHYCVVPDGSGFRARPVQIGPTNDKFVVIDSGLREGEEVVLHAGAYRAKVGLPESLRATEPKSVAARPSWGPRADARPIQTKQRP